MAGAGYKAFADGDVLTAAQVQTFLQDQAVMRFADSSARTTGLGTAVAEGMVSYLQDTDAVEVYDGSAWVGLGGGFTASTAITATDASWSVPTLADPLVRVTVVGGGGGGGAADSVTHNDGSAGSTTTFNAGGAGTVTAAGGAGGRKGGSRASGAAAVDNVLTNSNGGAPGVRYETTTTGLTGNAGFGGQVTVAYLNLEGVSTVNVSIGAGGAGGTSTGAVAGGAGGDGLVIFEYRAG